LTTRTSGCPALKDCPCVGESIVIPPIEAEAIARDMAGITTRRRIKRAEAGILKAEPPQNVFY
jgi:hypothetical protein